jgi:RNA polymerase sigma-70 factor, ECF subfamily
MGTEVESTAPAGDTAGLTDPMWREMVTRLRAFVRRRIADPNRADDLVAEVLLRIHQNIGSLEDTERLPNWAFRIAHNAIIDEYRRAGRKREQLVAALGDDVANATWLRLRRALRIGDRPRRAGGDSSFCASGRRS